MQLLETILCDQGKARHLEYHQKRLDRTFQALFQSAAPFRLQSFVKPPSKERLRCRVLYDQETITIEYHPYTPIYYDTFALIETDQSYDFKYADRTWLDQATAHLDPTTQAIFVKEGLITDTKIANIACLVEGKWLTPAKPLLQGTTRERLLDEKKLSCADISVEDCLKAEKIALFNALTGFYEMTHYTFI